MAVTVSFAPQNLKVTVRQSFDAEDVATAMDAMLHLQTTQSVHRVLRLFKLKTRKNYEDVKRALYDMWQQNTQSLRTSYSIVYYFDETVMVRIHSPTALPTKTPATETQVPKWMYACFAMLGATIYTGYQLGMFTTPPF